MPILVNLVASEHLFSYKKSGVTFIRKCVFIRMNTEDKCQLQLMF